jgi:opacity protein-like surface antigen
MKSVKKFCAALSLALLLMSSAMAGDIHGGFIDPPPPQGQQAQSTAITIQASETTNSNESSLDTLTEGVVSILQSVLSLF